MSNIWFSSDLHFNHDREFLYKPRGFESIAEMDNKIIENFNSVVKPEDTLYLLGDLSLGQDSNYSIKCLNSLNGHKKIIRGNHDTERRITFYKEYVDCEYLGWAEMIKINKRNYYLSHFPTLCNNFNEQAPYNLYGHTHQKNNFYQEMPMNYHVGVDSHNCFPVSIEEIETDIEKEIKKASGLISDANEAKWEINCDGYYLYCTNCGYESRTLDKFCPNCGSHMI